MYRKAAFTATHDRSNSTFRLPDLGWELSPVSRKRLGTFWGVTKEAAWWILRGE
jgi:hypothetical protein